jgi:hypothetical protein
MPGNTADKTTLRDFLQRIEEQYGRIGRTWVMDRGIPTEEVLSEMRQSKTPIHHLVGTPRGRLSQMERQFLDRPWSEVRETVRVKLVEQDGELYVLARSDTRREKEQAMRRRRLKQLVKRLRQLRSQKLSRDQPLIKLGAARKDVDPAVYRIIDIKLPHKDQPATPGTFSFLSGSRSRTANCAASRSRRSDPAICWSTSKIGLLGHYVVGFGYDSSQFKSFSSALPISAGVPDSVRHGNTQVWVLADQMLVRNGPGDQAILIALFGVVANDAENSPYAQQYIARLLDRGFWRAATGHGRAVHILRDE